MPAQDQTRVRGRWTDRSNLDADASPAQYAVPTTGQTVSMVSENLVLEPADTLAALTINLPGASDRYDGMSVRIMSTAILTALTVAAAGTTLVGAPTTLAAANGFFAMKYVASSNKWYRWG